MPDGAEPVSLFGIRGRGCESTLIGQAESAMSGPCRRSPRPARLRPSTGAVRRLHRRCTLPQPGRCALMPCPGWVFGLRATFATGNAACCKRAARAPRLRPHVARQPAAGIGFPAAEWRRMGAAPWCEAASGTQGCRIAPMMVPRRKGRCCPAPCACTPPWPIHGRAGCQKKFLGTSVSGAPLKPSRPPGAGPVPVSPRSGKRPGRASPAGNS